MIFRTLAGEGREVMGRRFITDQEVRRTVIEEMIVLRSKGYTDSEIAMKHRYSREWVNKLINSAPAEVWERLHEIGLV